MKTLDKRTKISENTDYFMAAADNRMIRAEIRETSLKVRGMRFQYSVSFEKTNGRADFDVYLLSVPGYKTPVTIDVGNTYSRADIEIWSTDKPKRDAAAKMLFDYLPTYLFKPVQKDE